MGLVETGLKLVNKGFKEGTAEVKMFTDAEHRMAQFLKRDAKSVTKSNEKMAKSYRKRQKAQDAATKSGKKHEAVMELLEDSFQAFGNLPFMGQGANQFLNLTGNIIGMKGSVTALAKVMGSGGTTTGLAGAFTVTTGAMVATGAAAAIAAAGVLALGARGAKLSARMQGFANTVGDGNKVLRDLRESTRGTVSDFELMTLANVSLTGMTKEFKDLLLAENKGLGETGNVLGSVIDVTNKYAAATGQSAEVLREKFLTGLRLGSKLRLDDIVGAIDQTKANEAYAKSNDLVASSLTDEQQKLALATEATRRMREEVAQTVGASFFVTDAIARMGAMVQNFVDKLSLLMLPIAEPFFQAFDAILQAVQQFTDAVFMVMAPLVDILVSLGSIVWSIVKPFVFLAALPLIGIFSAMRETIVPLVVALQLLAGAVEFVAEGFAKLSDAIINQIVNMVNGVLGVISGFASSLFGSIASPFRDMFSFLNQETDNQTQSLAQKFGYGAGRIMGGFAQGLISGSAVVLAVIAKIAKEIADFLVGESPPPKGALSKIDEGGQKTMEAWMEGFQNASLAPVDAVTSAVNERLGDIGKMNLGQVEARLGMLDKALQPFTDRLEIAKADMEAIAGFADPAIKVLERQIEQAIKSGKASSEQVQAMDKQLAMLNAAKNAEASRTDQIELQLALKKSEQAQERALLNIQKRRLGTVQQISGGAAAVKKAKSAAVKAAKKPTGKGGAEVAGAGRATGMGKGQAPDLFSSEAVEAARADLGVGFAEGLADSGAIEALDQLAVGAEAAQKQTQRIMAADPAARIAEKFAGLGDGIQEQLDIARENVNTEIKAMIEKVGEFNFDSMVTAISDFAANIAEDLQPVKDAFLGLLPEGVRTALETFFSEDGALGQAFADDGLFGANGAIMNAINSLFGEDSLIKQAFSAEGLSASFQLLLDTVSPILDTLKSTFESIFGSGANSMLWKAARTMNTVKGVIVSAFTSMFDGASSALGSIAEIISTNMLDPAVTALNGLLGAVENAFNTAIKALWDILPGIIKGRLGEQPRLSIDEISLGGVEGNRRGTLTSAGSFLAGENGAEFVNTRRGSTVFPSQATRALQALSASPVPLPIAGGGQINNTSNEISNTVNTTFNVGSQQEALLLEQQRLAFEGF